MFPYRMELHNMPNGATALVINTPKQSNFDLQINFRAGYRYAAAKQAQLPRVSQNSICAANDQFSDPCLLDRDFCRNGAYRQTTAGYDYLSYSAKSAIFEWERIVDCWQCSLCAPALNRCDIAAELLLAKYELSNRLSDSSARLTALLKKSIGLEVADLHDHLASLDNIDYSDVMDWYLRTHMADSASIIVAGDFQNLSQHSSLKYKLEELSAKLPKGVGSRPSAVELHSPTRSIVLRIAGRSMIDFQLMLFLPRNLSPMETVAGKVLCQLLTGGYDSRIAGVAHVKGWCSNIRASIESVVGCSWLTIGGRTSVDYLFNVIQLIADELKQLANGELSQTEASQAVDLLDGRRQIIDQTVDNVVRDSRSYYCLTGRIVEPLVLNAELRQIKSDDVLDLVNAWRQNGILVTGYVTGPRCSFTDDQANELQQLLAGAMDTQ